MAFSLYDASAPVFVNALSNMRAWLDKAEQTHDAKALFEAALAPDMRPLPAQYQMASDSAKNTIARIVGIEAPSMPDTEANFAELRERCDKTIAFVRSVDPATIAASNGREAVLAFPNGTGFKFEAGDYLTRFALPNFFFHVTTAYAIMRAQGVPLGKPDFLQHLGPPSAL